VSNTANGNFNINDVANTSAMQPEEYQSILASNAQHPQPRSHTQPKLHPQNMDLRPASPSWPKSFPQYTGQNDNMREHYANTESLPSPHGQDGGSNFDQQRSLPPHAGGDTYQRLTEERYEYTEIPLAQRRDTAQQSNCSFTISEMDSSATSSSTTSSRPPTASTRVMKDHVSR
jgi:hypothetical protein